jgi:glycogen phosphorylase
LTTTETRGILHKVALEFLSLAENIFIFGNNFADVSAIRQAGYQPMDRYRNDAGLREALDRIDSGFFSPGERSRYHDIFNCLVHHGDH